MVAKSRVDVVIQPIDAANASIEAVKLRDSLTILPKDYARMEFTLILSRKSDFSEDFLNRFDKIMTAMKNDGSYESLISKLRQGR